MLLACLHKSIITHFRCHRHLVISGKVSENNVLADDIRRERAAQCAAVERNGGKRSRTGSCQYLQHLDRVT